MKIGPAIHLPITDSMQQPWLNSNVVISEEGMKSLEELISWTSGYEEGRSISIPGRFDLIMFRRGIELEKKVSVQQGQLDGIYGLLHWLEGYSHRGGLIPGCDYLLRIYTALRKDSIIKRTEKAT